MEFKVKNNTFYLLDAGTEKWIFEDEENAIETLKKLVSESKELYPEKVSILEVNKTGESWMIKPMSWAKIAMRLMKEGK